MHVPGRDTKTGSLKKGSNPKGHLIFFFRDAVWCAELLQHLVIIFGINQHLHKKYDLFYFDCSALFTKGRSGWNMYGEIQSRRISTTFKYNLQTMDKEATKRPCYTLHVADLSSSYSYKNNIANNEI